MVSHPLHQSKFIFFLVFLLLIKTLNAQPNYLSSYCYNSGYYESDSLYKSNLDSLVSVLQSQSSYKGFYSYSSGSSPSTTVYGTYLCRGDISSSTCETCITRASVDVFTWCPLEKEAIIWYKECFLRYSNRQIFSILEQKRFVTSKSYDAIYYNEALENSIHQLIQEGYTSSSYFAKETYQVNFYGDDYDLNALVQCMPDLDQYDCYTCLKFAYQMTQNYCYGRSYALAYTTNCMLTYNATLLASSTLPPPPPEVYDSPSSDDSFSFKFKGKVFRKIIAPVIAAVVMTVAICVCSICCCRKKKKKENENERETSIEISTPNIDENLTVDHPIEKTESDISN